MTYRLLTGHDRDARRSYWPGEDRFRPEQPDAVYDFTQRLIVAEAEFHDDESMTELVPPSWCGPEITERAHFTGANLARLTALPTPVATAALATAIASAHR